MRFGRLVVISTIVAFILVVALCLVWLFKVTETEVSVSGENAEEIYDYLNAELDEAVKGKSIVFLSGEKISETLEKNPYAEVLSVKKVFPCKIFVEVKKRSERFAYLSGSTYYFTDENFVLLRSFSKLNSEKVVLVKTSGLNYDFETSRLGEKLDFSSDELLNSSVAVVGAIEDKLNVLKDVTLDGVKDRIYLNTVTGASVEFRYGFPPSVTSVAEKSALRTRVDSFAKDAYDRYLSLSEAEKSSGYVLCYLTEELKVKIDYVAKEPD